MYIKPLVGTLATKYVRSKISIGNLLFNIPRRSCEFFPTNIDQFIEKIDLNVVISSIYIEINTEENIGFINHVSGVLGLVITDSSIQCIEDLFSIDVFRIIPTEYSQFTLYTPDAYKQLIASENNDLHT